MQFETSFGGITRKFKKEIAMKKPIFVWEEREEELVHFCHVRKITITNLSDGYVEGEITAVDYVEHGITFSDPWEARLIDGTWSVKRKEDENGFWKDRNTGEFHFTANLEINRAMKVFVAEKIKTFIETGIAEMVQEKYEGPIKKYEGPCVCEKLKSSNESAPFSPTNLDCIFPSRCFLCSCGARWWSYNPDQNMWAPVNDDKAWEMFLTYNGEDFRKVTSLKGGGGFKLLSTLGEEGYIPLW